MAVREYEIFRDLNVGENPVAVVPSIEAELVSLYPIFADIPFSVVPKRGVRRDGSMRHYYLVSFEPPEPEILEQPLSGEYAGAAPYETTIEVAAGNSVQWESRPLYSGGAFAPIPGATSPTLSVSPLVDTEYRAVINGVLVSWVIRVYYRPWQPSVVGPLEAVKPITLNNAADFITVAEPYQGV